MDKPSDSDIVSRVLAGDRQAFALLIERHSGKVYSLALRLTGSRSDAEELVQETFVRAFCQLRRYDFRRAFFPWLYTLSLNLVRNHLKKSARTPTAAKLSRPLLEKDGPAGADTEQQLLEQQGHDQIQAALNALPLEHREILVLRFYQELTFKELAEILGTTPGAAKMRVYRALEQLRKKMER